MSLARAARSELTKQFTTSMWWLLAVVLVVYIGPTVAILGVVLALNTTGELPASDAGIPPVPADTIPPLLYSTATAVGYVFPLLIGALLVTGEFRHQTLTPTFLAVPRRGTALAAKVLAGIVMGLLYAAIAIAVSVGAGAGILAGFGVETQLGDVETWTLIARMLLALLLWVLVGIGVGSLVRNQVAAVVGVIAFTQLLEPILRLAASFAPDLSDAVQYLPGAASDALVGASLYTTMTAGASAAETPVWWVGGLVLLGYALVFLVAGYLTSWRRDVT